MEDQPQAYFHQKNVYPSFFQLKNRNCTLLAMGCLKLTYLSADRHDRPDKSLLFISKGAENARNLAQRFISTDPLKDKYSQLSPYQYAGNDPIGDIDVDGLEGTKTKEPPKTFQGFPILSQRQIAIGEGDGRVIQRETRFKIRPGLGGRVTENIFGRGDNQRTERVSSGIFGIERPSRKPAEPTRLDEVVVEGERINLDVKKVFGQIKDNDVNNFVFNDTAGIKATRLTTAGRKTLQTAINAASITPIGGLVATGVQVFAGTADENTALGGVTASSELISGTLKETDVLTDLFKGISSLADKGLLALNQAAILDSPATEEELLTELLFLELKTNPDRIGRFVPGKEFEQFLFNEELSQRGVGAITDILNNSLANLKSEIKENEIDITTDEGFNRAKQAIIKKNQK